MKKNSARCFTLIEILAAVSIIGILAALVVGLAGAANEKRSIAQTEASIQRLKLALEEVKQKHGFYPPSNGGMLYYSPLSSDLSLTAQGDKKYPEKYIQTFRKAVGTDDIYNQLEKVGEDIYVFADAWGYPIYYRSPGKHNQDSYDLFSAGPDGKPSDNSNMLFSASGETFSLKVSDPAFDNKTHDDIGTF